MLDDTAKHLCSGEISITDHAVSLDSDTVLFTGMLLLKYVCLVSGILSLVCFTGFDGNTVGTDSCAFKLRTTYS